MIKEERQQTALKSNGVYSVMNNKWIKEPVAEDIPELDEEAFNKEFKTWEDKYFEIKENPSVEGIENFIEDIYDLRKYSIAKDGEYGIGNLVFKECRNLGYLDDLKDIKKELKDKELSLESLNEEKITDKSKFNEIQRLPTNIAKQLFKDYVRIMNKALSDDYNIEIIPYEVFKKQELRYDELDNPEKAPFPFGVVASQGGMFSSIGLKNREDFDKLLYQMIDINTSVMDDDDCDDIMSKHIRDLINLFKQYSLTDIAEEWDRKYMQEEIIGEAFNKNTSNLKDIVFDILDDLNNSGVATFENLLKILEADGVKYEMNDVLDYFKTYQAKLNDKDINQKDVEESLYSNIGESKEDMNNPDITKEHTGDTDYLQDYVSWDSTEGKAKREADYRRFAEISEDFVITEENINEWALNSTCANNFNYPRDKVLAELLNK